MSIFGRFNKNSAMKYTFIPRTKIRVSKICLGTMTWGRQNSEEEAFAQMDYALEQGVNFFDTAELYPIPAHPDRFAHTEIIIGNWFKKRGKREDIILASKIAGLSPLQSGPHHSTNGRRIRIRDLATLVRELGPGRTGQAGLTPIRK